MQAYFYFLNEVGPWRNLNIELAPLESKVQGDDCPS